VRRAAGVLALGVVLVVVAGTFDAEPLYVPGVAFVVLAGGCAAWVALAARGVTIGRSVELRRVVEDDPLDVYVAVAPGPLPLPGGELRDALLDRPVRLGPGRGGRRLRIRARFGRRGRRTIAPPQVLVRDPLGLATRAVQFEGVEEVLVLPRVSPVIPVRGAEGDGARRRGRPAIAAEVELDGVREHRPGTPASRIYWPALARGQGMMERRLRSESDATPMVVLDARASEREEDLDAAVRAAASLAVALAKDGGASVLLPGDRRPTVLDSTLAGWPHLHARLALVQPGGRPLLSGVASRVGPVLYVAARVPSRPPRALEHAPAAARVLVVPGVMPGRRALFSVAGCHGFDIEPARARRRRAVA
jgi:uncharacterized protein (DUF58 family)